MTLEMQYSDQTVVLEQAVLPCIRETDAMPPAGEHEQFAHEKGH